MYNVKIEVESEGRQLVLLSPEITVVSPSMSELRCDVMASSKEYSYLAIDPGEIPVEDDLLMVTTNWVFVTKLFPFDSNRNMVSLENRKLLIECINEDTEEVLLTTIDMHDRNLVEQKEDHYEIKHMLLKTGDFKVYFILDSMIVCLLFLADYG